MKNFFAIYGFLIFLSFQGLGQTNLYNFEMESSIDSIVTLGLTAQAYPGAQVFIAHKGKTILNKSYGYHTYDSLRTVKNTNLYDLASITKVSSGLPLLMQAYGQGNFDLDAPLEKYFPRFKNKEIGALSLIHI